MSIDFEKLNALEDKAKSFLDNYTGENPIALYGAGKSAVNVVSFFKKHGITAVGIMDTDDKKWGDDFCGLEIFPVEELLAKYKNLEVFISAPSYEKSIRKALLRYIPEERIHYFENEHIFFCGIEESREYIRTHEKEILKVYGNLEDDCSKYIMENILSLWCSADERFLENCYSPNQYFSEGIVSLGAHEKIVDCGAYTGDTLQQFKDVTKDKYDHYYGFEPQEESFKILQEKCADDPRNTVFPYGASNEKKELRFSSGNDTGHAAIGTAGDTLIRVVPMDEYINDEVTFIKMDIEGSELSALKGAEGIIKRYKPKLAICIYHKVEDIVEIPEFIMGLGLDYKYYIRHHQQYVGTETVFYAV